MSLPFHQLQIWDGKMFLKVISLKQRFVMHLGHNGKYCQSRGTPWMMCQWLEQMKRRSKRRIYLKMFLRLWAIKILLSFLTAMGFPSPHPMVCLPRISPTSHPTVQTWSVFSQCHPAQDCFTFDVLDHFYMDAMECKTAGLSFFQS